MVVLVAMMSVIAMVSVVGAKRESGHCPEAKNSQYRAGFRKVIHLHSEILNQG